METAGTAAGWVIFFHLPLISGSSINTGIGSNYSNLPIASNRSSSSSAFPGPREHGGESSLLVSPLLVAGVVIGLVLFLSCATIVVGSLRKDSRFGPPARGREAADERTNFPGMQLLGSSVTPQTSEAAHGRTHTPFQPSRHEKSFGTSICLAGSTEAPDGFSPRGSSAELRSTCTEEFPPACDFDSYLDILSQVNIMYPDPPPCYDECVGPGATQIYIPTDDPPPYSLMDPCQRNEIPLDICISHEEEAASGTAGQAAHSAVRLQDLQQPSSAISVISQCCSPVQYSGV